MDLTIWSEWVPAIARRDLPTRRRRQPARERLVAVVDKTDTPGGLSAWQSRPTDHSGDVSDSPAIFCNQIAQSRRVEAYINQLRTRCVGWIAMSLAVSNRSNLNDHSRRPRQCRVLGFILGDRPKAVWGVAFASFAIS